MTDFDKEVDSRLNNVPNESKMIEAASAFVLESTPPKYSYNFSWYVFWILPEIIFPFMIATIRAIIW